MIENNETIDKSIVYRQYQNVAMFRLEKLDQTQYKI